MPQYVMQAPIQPVDEGYGLQGHVQTRDGQTPRGIPVMLPTGETPMQYALPQLTAQMNAIQLQPAGSYMPTTVSFIASSGFLKTRR